MGVSFKVSKTGTRFRPRPVQPDAAVEEDDAVVNTKEIGKIIGHNESTSTSTKKLEVDVTRGEEDFTIPESEVSFTLNLFPDGYSIGNPSEATLQDGQKFLHPYDRTSETLFSAIESGRLPGDILDDIPCKYVDGKLVCEVRDFRKCTSEAGFTVSSSNGFPVVHKVQLRMSLENVVKDIPSISDTSWTYGDLMEVESRILKALQPELCLDPTPKLDRLCDNPVPTKLNLALCSLRRKRLRQIPEITVTSNNKIHGKKVCIDGVPESSNCRSLDAGPIYGAVMHQNMHDNLTAQNMGSSNLLAQRATKGFVPDASVALPIISQPPKYQLGVGNPRTLQDHGSGLISNAPGASPSGQDMMVSYANHMNSNVSSVQGKRENQDGQLSPLLNKRARLTSLVPDAYQQQHVAPNMDSFQGSDSHWKATLLQQQSIARGINYANTGMNKYPQQVFEGGLNQEGGMTQFTVAQQGMRNAKEEPIETERLEKPELNQTNNEMHMLEAERNHIDLQQSRLQQRLPQHGLMRSNFPQTPWSSLGQPLDNNSRKEDQFPKRKPVQSPRVSAGGLPQSPLSSKSGEFSSGSMGHQFGPVAASAFGSSQKEKMAVTSGAAVGGTTSMTSSASDAMQRQHQAQPSNKRRSNSLPKTPAMSGVGSPASVSNMSVPLNASSPPVGTPPLADPVMLDRFSKIEIVAGRHQLNRKKIKDEQPIRKPTTYPTNDLLGHLSSDFNNEDFRDETCTMPLSKSLEGGSMNACKIRVLKFERVLQGNGFSIVPRTRTRMILSGKPNDGTIAMHYGDIEDNDYWAIEDYLPTLPNAHMADLLASQLHSLMKREGYDVEDYVQPRPARPNRASTSQSNASGITQNKKLSKFELNSREREREREREMQGSSEESKVTSSPSMAAEFSQQLNSKMKLHDLDFSQMEKAVPLYDEEVQLDGGEEEGEEEEEEEEEFTFACVGSDELPISADDAFRDGQVKPTFPLFDQSLVSGAGLAPAREDLARRPQVKKVFIEADESPSTRTAEEEIEDLERETPAGLYCTWSRKAVESSPETCKKSNSTGFSKIWRLRELTNRSNSDGRDAFVFLNNNNNNNGKTTTYSKREEKREGEVKATSETTTFSKGEEKVIKVKKGKKGETTSLSSAHELHYAKNRALREGDRRRSYLPYKPGLVGFFTNVNGGLSRNVHPF